MIADAIKDVSSRGGIVLDLFGGSGSTLIAAHKTGRRGYLCEIDQVYCDRILARWEHYAKDEAILLACGWEASKPGPLPQSTGEQETDQSLQVKERDHAG
jgi:tRNA G10  N-methylase Trm11